MQHAIDCVQFGRAFHFKSKVREADRPIDDRGGKIESRLVNPPVGVTRAAAARSRIEQAGIESDRVRQTIDHDIQMKPFHAVTFFGLGAEMGRQTAGAQVSGAPSQQFSVR